MHKSTFLDIDYSKFTDADYVEYESRSIELWNKNNEGKYNALPDTFCWENTRMKQLVWDTNALETKDIAKQLNMDVATVTSIEQPPGSVIPLHIDSFYQLRKKYPDKPDPVRANIFLEDWKLGHFLQCDDKVYTHWKKGEGVLIGRGVPHLSANAGVQNKYTLQVSGFIND